MKQLGKDSYLKETFNPVFQCFYKKLSKNLIKT